MSLPEAAAAPPAPAAAPQIDAEALRRAEEALVAEKNDLRAKEADLRDEKANLRTKEARRDRNEAELSAAKKAKPGRLGRAPTSATLVQAVADAQKAYDDAKADVNSAKQAMDAQQRAVDVQAIVVRNQQIIVNNLRNGLTVPRFVRVANYLARPLAEIVRTQDAPEGSLATSTKRARRVHVTPMKVLQWTDDAFGISQFRAACENMDVVEPRKEELEYVVNEERGLEMPFTNLIQGVQDAMHGVYSSRGFDKVRFMTTAGQGSGKKDFVFKLGLEGRLRGIGEFKSQTVLLETDKGMWQVFDETVAQQRPPTGVTGFRNTISLLVQTFTYAFEEEVEYFFMMNWHWWAFAKRTLVANNEEVVLVTRWYKWDQDARLALCNFMRLTMETAEDGGGLKQGVTGGTLPLLNSLNEEREKERARLREAALEDDRTRRSQPGQRPIAPRAAKSSDNVTTKEALGTYLFNLPNRTTISRSTKSTVSRGLVAGKELVWKTVDFYGTPHHSEFTGEDLNTFMDTEIAVYAKLKALQGRVIPEFVFCGSDLNSMWVFVTTYEGRSLSALSELGELRQEDMDRARDALMRIHDEGVLHGDVALRNAVRRERDGAVLWVDFEASRVAGDDVDASVFHVEALRELDALDACFDEVQFAPESSVEHTSSVLEQRASSEGKIVESAAAGPVRSRWIKRQCIVPCCGGSEGQ